jgi:hypothetical protein
LASRPTCGKNGPMIGRSARFYFWYYVISTPLAEEELRSI